MKGIVIAYFILLSACNRKPILKTGLEGQPLPEFKLLLADSSTVFSSKAISKNKSVILFFFSPYCPYCRAQLRSITSNMDQVSNFEIVILAAGPFSAIRSAQKEFSLIEFSNIILGRGQESIVRYFKPSAIPFLAVYDSEKKLKGCFLGKTTVRELTDLANN